MYSMRCMITVSDHYLCNVVLQAFVCLRISVLFACVSRVTHVDLRVLLQMSVSSSSTEESGPRASVDSERYQCLVGAHGEML